MNYPGNIEEKIGFDLIKELLEEACVSELGKSNIRKLTFSNSKAKIQQQLDQVAEYKSLLESHQNIPGGTYYDLRERFRHAAVKANYLTAEDLTELLITLETFMSYRMFFTADHKLENLEKVFQNIEPEPERIQELDAVVDRSGKVKDRASEELRDIRQQIKSKTQQVEHRLQRVLNQSRKEGWIEHDVEPTIRNGRLVIPVKASDKGRLRGFVHDSSASGQTLFIEPEDAFLLNNEIRELEQKEQQEIIRILQVFTQKIRPELPLYSKMLDCLGALDAIRAKARFALQIKADSPQLITEPLISWQKAIHPLLYLSFQKQGRQVVPMDIDLNPAQRILLISGPNAGGKSVALKAVGLIQYMLQCGLLVPVSSDSVCGIFDNILIDIGDEQSMENDLSTYTSHLANMKYFIENASGKSLILIDEFGTGTEPGLGGAIAEAILERFNNQACYGLITTHYGNLKTFADQTDGILNAAMLFDIKQMKPLFMLKIGKPGSSFAFEMARQIGFPDDIIESAKNRSGQSRVDYDEQLQQLEAEQKKLEEQQRQFELSDNFLNELIHKYEKLNHELQLNRQKEIREARQEAARIIANANKKIEQTIREIRSSAAQKVKTKELRQELEQEKSKLIEKSNTQPPPQSPKPKKWNIGDWVSIAGMDVSGQIISINKEDVHIQFDQLQLQTQTKKLIPARAPKTTSIKKKSSLAFDRFNRQQRFELTLDVRGKDSTEAMSLVEKQLDQAIGSGIQTFNVLHGKGTGVLKDSIRKMLRQHDSVQSVSDAPHEHGGAGITVVILS